MTKAGPYDDAPIGVTLASSFDPLGLWKYWTANGSPRRVRHADLLFNVTPVVKGRAASEPASPTINDAWILSDVWGGGAVNQIAVYDGTSWLFLTPKNGAVIPSHEETGLLERYATGTGWSKYYPLTEAELSQVLAAEPNPALISEAEIDLGTGTDERTISAERLAYAIGSGASVSAYVTDALPAPNSFTSADTLVPLGVVQVGLRFDSLADVNDAGKTDGSVYVYDSGSGTMIVADITDIDGYNPALLADHSAIDVISTDGSITITSPSIDSDVDIETTFGGSGGDFGTADDSARSDHTHTGDEAYSLDPQISFPFGTPSAGEAVRVTVLGRTLQLASGLNSNADVAIAADTAPASAVKVLVYKSTDAGSSYTKIGEFTIATDRSITSSDDAGGGASSFPQTDFATGNVIKLVLPNPADASLDGFSATLKFTRTA